MKSDGVYGAAAATAVVVKQLLVIRFELNRKGGKRKY
jgi:hypothetical protein